MGNQHRHWGEGRGRIRARSGRALACLAALLAAGLACSLPGAGNDGGTGAATRSAAETEAAAGGNAATQAPTPGGLGGGDLTPGAGEATEATEPGSEATEPAAEATTAETTGAPTTAPGGSGAPGAYAAQTACDHPYFPLRQGAEWQYDSDQGPYSWAVTEVTGNTDSATATMVIEVGETTVTYHWECDDRGLVSYDFGNIALANAGGNVTYELQSASGVFLPPADEVVPGAAWEREYSVVYQFDMQVTQVEATADVLETLTVGDRETVAVPAGEFEALVLRDVGVFAVNISNAGPTNLNAEVTYWLAHGIGMVRQVSHVLEMEVTTELVSYTMP